jgi:uncharacterized protein (DUF3820 family)
LKKKENNAGSACDSETRSDTELLRTQLLELVEYRMPFGKYQGRRLVDLPEPYVVWFAQQGFPQGKLGELLSIVYEIKVNGLEYLFEPLK